jgi:diadenosine tetraphosphatase ApaH/serine/threonine PP2A family protein phosphatase
MKECDGDCTLLGNHDYAFLNGFLGWESAQRSINAIIYARKQLKFHTYQKSITTNNILNWLQKLIFRKSIESYPRNSIKSNKHIDWILNLKMSFHLDNNFYVHGSPRNPLREYLSPDQSIEEYNVFNDIKHLCFVGHSHIPGVYSSSDKQWYSPKDINHQYIISDDKAVINIGSVGQPRDEDTRACYGIFDGSLFVWRRVEYNIQGTVNQILKIVEIDNFMADRLLIGR